MSALRRWRRRMLPKTVPVLYWLVRLHGDSVRLKPVGWERYEKEERPIIFAAWHGRSFLATKFFRNLGYWILASNSRDGEMQNRLFRRFGFLTIRGSTGREGVRAAIESIRVLKTGARMTLTPDGPRGPSGVVQPGILTMAQKSGALIVPVGVSARNRWLFRSWDRYMVPKPFTKAVMVFGEPIEVPTGATAEQLESLRLEVERAMAAIEDDAERMVRP